VFARCKDFARFISYPGAKNLSSFMACHLLQKSLQAIFHLGGFLSNVPKSGVFSVPSLAARRGKPPSNFNNFWDASPPKAAFLIQDWQAAGLLKPSILKPLIATIEDSHIERILGQFTLEDKQTLALLLKTVLGP